MDSFLYDNDLYHERVEEPISTKKNSRNLKSSFLTYFKNKGKVFYKSKNVTWITISNYYMGLYWLAVKKKLDGPFSWKGFNCLKATATSRRYIVYFLPFSYQKFLVPILLTSEGFVTKDLRPKFHWIWIESVKFMYISIFKELLCFTILLFGKLLTGKKSTCLGFGILNLVVNWYFSFCNSII